MEIYGIEGDPGQLTGEFFERMREVLRRRYEADGSQEIEFLPVGREPADHGGARGDVRFQNRDDPFPQAADRAELHDIDARHHLSQLFFAQYGGDPVGEIVRRLGREIFVLLQRAVRVMINTGTGHFFYQCEEFFHRCRFQSHGFREVEPGAELKGFVRFTVFHSIPP
jgi:hypothetical protein